MICLLPLYFSAFEEHRTLTNGSLEFPRSDARSAVARCTVTASICVAQHFELTHALQIRVVYMGVAIYYEAAT